MKETEPVFESLNQFVKRTLVEASTQPDNYKIKDTIATMRRLQNNKIKKEQKKIARINANGIKQILEFLRTYHKLSVDNFTLTMVCELAIRAEDYFNYGRDTCYFYIHAYESKQGVAIGADISPEGFDVELNQGDVIINLGECKIFIQDV
jgi:hypothetical protein